MAKVLWTENEEQFDHKNHPGCIPNIFHVLEWHSNVKKILPHRKHEALIKNPKRNRRYKRISDDQDPLEGHILVDQCNRKTGSPQKRSLKARIKALVSEDMDKDVDQDFVPSPKLQRTYSIHHLETNEWVHPIIFFPDSVTESPVSSKEYSDVTHPEMTDPRDILDMFEVDKELFLDILEVHSRAFDTKPKLTKSGSFPTAYKPGSRDLIPMKLKDKVNEFFPTSKAEKRLDSELNILGGSMHLGRISSLNESADRNSELFDFSVGKEAALRTSRSLKLTDGSENLLSSQQPSFSRRNHSLRLVENPSQESRAAYFHRSFSQNERNPISVHSNNLTELSSTQDFECSNEVIDKNENFSEDEYCPEAKIHSCGVDTYEMPIKKDSHQIPQEIANLSSVLTPEYCPPDEDIQLSEGLQENLMESKNFKSKKDKVRSMRLYREDDDFTYVKQILQLSGFIKNGFQQTWHSSSQPLDPFVFQEIESQYYHDPERFAEEINELSRRLLIFDLVDEVLITMYKRSSPYYPKALSSSCHISTAPTGSRFLDAVWKRIRQLLSLKPDMNDSLNDIVFRDLGRDDGWMNLQLDSECVGVNLEDLILDEVIEDMLFEFI
uniref:protein TRM32-like n=1 Tax=Erigeron canadensis TaxID=72917 RepID=UPI001CB9CD9D|nr:protein TRM32-like [Erigeron canadensis]